MTSHSSSVVSAAPSRNTEHRYFTRSSGRSSGSLNLNARHVSDHDRGVQPEPTILAVAGAVVLCTLSVTLVVATALLDLLRAK